LLPFNGDSVADILCGYSVTHAPARLFSAAVNAQMLWCLRSGHVLW